MIKYIFSANPGRAGSAYLATLFGHAEGVSAHHEPEPIMNRLPMIEFLNGRPQKLEALMPIKLRAINDALKPPYHTYAETNHAFVRGFGWLLPKLIPEEQIGVVILRRDSDAVARSLYRIGANAFNNNGRGWLIHINARNRITPRPDIPFLLSRYYYYRFLHRLYYFAKARPRLTLGAVRNRGEPETPFELNMVLLRWYVDEVYAIAEEYRRTFPRIRFYEVSVDELNNLNKVVEMFDYFGLNPMPSIASAVGKRINTKPMVNLGKPPLNAALQPEASQKA